MFLRAGQGWWFAPLAEAVATEASGGGGGSCYQPLTISIKYSSC